MHEPAEALEEALGYRFNDRNLLLRALTHRSWLAEQGSPMPEACDNEQLEFVGDSILGLIVSEALFLRFPQEREGRLSQLKAHLVSANHLHQCAAALRLGAFLQLGKGEERNGGRERKTLLANALEALIAAFYLDGGLSSARLLIERWILSSLDSLLEMGPTGLLNYKNLLQEKARALGHPFPRYATVASSGPDHERQFTVEVRLSNSLAARATGTSKKTASQLAAEKLYQQLVQEAQ